MWSNKAIIKIINELEEQFPVHEWTVNNIHVWPLVRTMLCFKIEAHALSKSKLSCGSRIVMLFKNLANDFKAHYQDKANHQIISENTHKSEGVIFFSDTNRRASVKNKWYDVYCSPIIETLHKYKMSYTFLEYCADTGVYKTPRYEKTFFIARDIKFIGLMHKIKNIFTQDKEIGQYKLIDYEKVYNYLDELGISECLASKAEIVNNLNLIIKFAEYYKKHIYKTKPAVGMVVCYYGRAAMAFMLACKQCGIPVVDIQHGIQGETHFAYGKWNNIPQSGYELLPDVFAVWSDNERLAIERWANKTNGKHEVYVLGNMWNEMWKNSIKTSIVKSMENDIRSILEEKKYNFNVLYTLNPEITTPQILYDAIVKTPHILWWIRLHPRMMKQFESILIEWKDYRNVIVKEATLLPLPALLQHMGAHVTYHSSVVLDAQQFGISSIIIDKQGEDLYKEAIAQGKAVCCYDTSSIVATVQRILDVDKKNDHLQSVIDIEKSLLELFNFVENNRKSKVEE